MPPRDYKYRANDRRRDRRGRSSGLAKWLVGGSLVLAFVTVAVLLGHSLMQLELDKLLAHWLPKKTEPPPAIAAAQPVPPVVSTEPATPEEPRYDFYTMLPQAEVVVPDYEINTRVREERVGKGKVVHYIIQAGSYKESAEAEKQKARLATLGIDATVERAKVGDNTIWFRVKAGPYDNSASVAKVKALLQKNGIGVIVAETEN